jgi:hypothetical protein
MSPFDEEYARTILPQLEAEIGALNKRIVVLEATLKDREAIDARRSSIEVGTPAKGGALKVSLDPFGDKQANEDAVNETKRLLALAGGAPLPPAEVK